MVTKVAKAKADAAQSADAVDETTVIGMTIEELKAVTADATVVVTKPTTVKQSLGAVEIRIRWADDGFGNLRRMYQVVDHATGADVTYEGNDPLVITPDEAKSAELVCHRLVAVTQSRFAKGAA